MQYYLIWSIFFFLRWSSSMHPGTLETLCVKIVENYTSWRCPSCVWSSPLRLFMLCLSFLNKIGMHFWWVCFPKFLWRIFGCYFFQEQFFYYLLCIYTHYSIFAIFTYFKAFGLTFWSTLSLRRYLIFITHMGFHLSYAIMLQFCSLFFHCTLALFCM